MILISAEHGDDRLNGTLANLLRGSGAARIRIYDDSGSPERPAAITDATTGVLLATFTLTTAVGAVVGHKLMLELPPDALVMANGRARYARVSNQNDDPSFDCDVSDAAGSGNIKLQTVDLLAGGAVRLVSAELT